MDGDACTPFWCHGVFVKDHIVYVSLVETVSQSQATNTGADDDDFDASLWLRAIGDGAIAIGL